MVVEHDTIEEYVEVLSTFDSSDQLKLISELTRRLADSAVEVTDAPEATEVESVRKGKKADTVPVKRLNFEQNNNFGQDAPVGGYPLDSDWNPKEELAKISKEHREKYGEVGDSWKELVGVWKDSTPDNLMELIRADRGPEEEPSNFDG